MAAYYDKGKYRAKIVSQALGENNKGNPEVQLVIKPIGMYVDKDPEPAHIDAEHNRTIYLVLTDATIGTPERPGWVLQTLTFLGFRGSSFAQLDPDNEDHVSFVGQEIDAICDVEDYQGKEREKWSIHRPGSGAKPPKPMEKKALRALDAKFGKTLKATVAAAPALSCVTSDEPVTKPEDVPF